MKVLIVLVLVLVCAYDAFGANVTDYGACNFNGVGGTCMDVHSCPAGHSSGLALCPGAANIQCCFPGPAPHLINVPLVCQLPQLKNGCEVTSLTMVLNWAGIHVDKMTLASQVAKDPTPYSKINGVIHWGNPNVGFVGDITGRTLGYSVYHGPVTALAKRYHNAIDLSGQSFQQVLNHVSAGSPVWVITSFSFNTVPASEWQTVYSKEGPYQMSFNEHSVVITGWNNDHVWVNDPYHNIKDRLVARAGFESAWGQFGRQAIILA